MSGELDFAIMHTPADIRTQPQFHFDIMRRDPFVIALAPRSSADQEGGMQGRISIPGSGCKTAEKRKFPDAAQITAYPSDHG